MTHRRVAVLILAGLVIFSAFALFFSWFAGGFNPSSYVATISTFSIAVLTVVYVLTTSGQLEVMKRQLSEMEATRRLDAQPLPILTLKSVELECPRLFFTPREDQHSFHSRLTAFFSMTNHSAHPAVNVVVRGTISLGLPSEPDSPKTMECSSEQVDVIGPGQCYPSDPAASLSFFLTDDGDSLIVAKLRETGPGDLVTLVGRAFYCNVLGAGFALETAFLLSPKTAEDFELLRKWHTMCASFPVQHAEDLRLMRRLRREKNLREWSNIFETLRDDLLKRAGPKSLELSWVPMPGSFRLRTIASDEYQREAAAARLPWPLPPFNSPS